MGKRKPRKKYITWEDRCRIEMLLKANCSVAEIAKDIDATRQGVYTELKRGGTPYSAEKAQKSL